MLIPFDQFLLFLQDRSSRRKVFSLLKILVLLICLISVYSILFHLIMLYEGRNYSFITGVYWSLTVMSTLGFGDITFHTDLGLFFTLCVLLSGIIFMLIILPFTFIQFFYAPWLELQEKRKTPSILPKETSGHVIIAGLDPVTTKLITQLEKRNIPHVLLAEDLQQAQEMRDSGFTVVVGLADDPKTYENVRVENARMVVATGDDLVNTNISFTVREITDTVPIVTNAQHDHSLDILEFPGNMHVFQFMKMLGEALAARALGASQTISIIATYDGLCIGAASAIRTPLVGKRVYNSGLRRDTGITIVGIWEKGKMLLPSPDTEIHPFSILVLAGTARQFETFSERYSLPENLLSAEDPVLVLGGGRVGDAVAKSLQEKGVPFNVVEKQSTLIRDDRNYTQGNAADIEVLKKSGIDRARSIIITTHDDDMNIYLTFYCRQLRKDVQIISRATTERNVSKLHRAGADLVMSYSALGVGAIMNILLPEEVSVFTDGLVVFSVPAPSVVLGKTIADSNIREKTGCSIVALRREKELLVNPEPQTVFRENIEVILVGSAEAERLFTDFAKK